MCPASEAEAEAKRPNGASAGVLFKLSSESYSSKLLRNWKAKGNLKSKQMNNHNFEMAKHDLEISKK